MRDPVYPSLYQINTRALLTELSSTGHQSTFDDISDQQLDRIAEMGFDWVWLLSVWQTGTASLQVSRTDLNLRAEFEAALPDLQEEDITGSGFAITGYEAHSDFGGDDALARLRERLQSRGIRLMLDFVANHTALDHPWVREHPEYFVNGTEADLIAAPHNFVRLTGANGSNLILAHGRDPYYPGWADTLQLNYGNKDLQRAMGAELLKIAARCDGVRCDMAMLLLSEVFERTWGIRSSDFWKSAIDHVRSQFSEFVFLAEVYWDLEWTMQQLGFDYAYDKRLYDRLRAGKAGPVRDHLRAELDYQSKLARFLENHDEPRAAATFPFDMHRAAATITYLSPGMRFFHQGQMEGRTVHISAHLRRGPVEAINVEIEEFYDSLLGVLRHPAIKNGQWRLLECVEAWEGNWTWDCFIAFAWREKSEALWLSLVNFAANHSQCYLKLPFDDLSGAQWRLTELLGNEVYDRDGDDLTNRGLYLDVPPWYAAVFSVKKL